jgi:serine phosphatase RsbU (regulator of sigma subunit)
MRKRNSSKLQLLMITGQGRQWEVPLDPKGTLVGRGLHCGVRLADHRVSSQHARILQDPFGRWIVEDLDSKNGVYVEGQRIGARAILPQEEILIGPYTLSLGSRLPQAIKPDLLSNVTTSIIDSLTETGVVKFKTGEGETLSVGRIKKLNHISDRLAGVSKSSRLYSELCLALADSPQMAALVLHLPRHPEPLPQSPSVLACHIAGQAEGYTDKAAASLHLSRRVLEAARKSEGPVMARSAPANDRELGLTVVESGHPRTVVCGVIATLPQSLEAVYLDMPSEIAGADIMDFAHAAIRQTKLLRDNLLLSEKLLERRIFDSHLALAREIQESLLPKKTNKAPGVDVAWYYQPALWVGGGDLCDVWPLGDGRLAFAVGDVSGKGLPGAMVMAILHAAMRSTAIISASPASVMDRLNLYLKSYLPEGMFVSLLLAFFDPASGILEHANAGHLPPLVLKSAGTIHPLAQPRELLLGVEAVSYTGGTTVLEPGSRVLVFTDGVTEAASPDGTFFGDDGLRSVVKAAGKDVSSEQLVNHVVQAVTKFRHPLGQQDDITVLALARRGLGSSPKVRKADA